ncbi:hypothetical protein [Tateyamaria sp. syn59]|uniref:hypothetical protein n=1 Tax=Tateyamaria sp. syn59 TaxID=2576942 RepID=UPI0011BEA199|nr:hypothetical protein [Tateyamaria sp. syn59]
MAKLSLNKAEKVARKTKKTIKKDLDEGRLSGSKNARGHWEIEESELSRFYDLNTSDLVSTPPQTPRDTDENTSENRIKIAELEAEVKALRREVERTDMERERERENLSKHIEDMRTAMAVLTDQRGQGGKPSRWEHLKALVTG